MAPKLLVVLQPTGSKGRCGDGTKHGLIVEWMEEPSTRPSGKDDEENPWEMC